MAISIERKHKSNHDSFNSGHKINSLEANESEIAIKLNGNPETERHKRKKRKVDEGGQIEDDSEPKKKKKKKHKRTEEENDAALDSTIKENGTIESGSVKKSKKKKLIEAVETEDKPKKSKKNKLDTSEIEESTVPAKKKKKKKSAEINTNDNEEELTESNQLEEKKSKKSKKNKGETLMTDNINEEEIKIKHKKSKKHKQTETDLGNQPCLIATPTNESTSGSNDLPPEPVCDLMTNISCTPVPEKPSKKSSNRLDGSQRKRKGEPLSSAADIVEIMVGEVGNPEGENEKLPEGTKLKFKHSNLSNRIPGYLLHASGAKKAYKHLIKGDIIVGFKNTNLHEIAGYATKQSVKTKNV